MEVKLYLLTSNDEIVDEEGSTYLQKIIYFLSQSFYMKYISQIYF